MVGSQCYISSPNGVILCADKAEDGDMGGRLYHAYSARFVQFSNVTQAFFELERIYDYIHFPHPENAGRFFTEQKEKGEKAQERIRVMSNEELLGKHGDLGTFIVRVQYRQNGSFQGGVTWMDRNKTVCFRSAWELMKLISSALDDVSGPEVVSWETEDGRSRGM